MRKKGRVKWGRRVGEGGVEKEKREVKVRGKQVKASPASL